MKYKLLIGLLALSFQSFSQTPITNSNFRQAIVTCLNTNSVDGLCYNSEYGAMPMWDVSAVTIMDSAFYNINNFNCDISNWDVSNVNSMVAMFYRNHDFNQNISSWDVGNVTNMVGMFSGAQSFNSFIGEWDVNNVTIMAWTFAGAYSFNQDISNWDVTNVIDMTWMFYDNNFNQDISEWCVETIDQEPFAFTLGCPLLPEYQPHWGEECISGIFDNETNSIVLYPNPSDGSFTVNIEVEKINKINVYNQENQLVLISPTNENVLNISKLIKGLYIVEIVTDKSIYISKIIKE